MQYRLILPALVILWTVLSFVLKFPPASLALTPLLLLYWVWREGWSGLSPALVLLLGQATAYIIFFKTTQSQNIVLGWTVGAGSLLLFLLAYLRLRISARIWCSARRCGRSSWEPCAWGRRKAART